MQRGAEEFCELISLPAASRQSRIRFLLESCSAALQAGISRVEATRLEARLKDCLTRPNNWADSSGPFFLLDCIY